VFAATGDALEKMLTKEIDQAKRATLLRLLEDAKLVVLERKSFKKKSVKSFLPIRTSGSV
jgi:hypothetical protein